MLLCDCEFMVLYEVRVHIADCVFVCLCDCVTVTEAFRDCVISIV